MMSTTKILNNNNSNSNSSPNNALRLPALLLITILLQLLIIFTFFHRPPPLIIPPNNHHHHCKYGKVFVYDLPPIFNKHLLNNCHDLDPWTSRCHALSNAGFGPKATGLEGVVPSNLLPAWYWTDMYSAEVIYHTRMINNNYTCTTTHPQEATAFYIPFYAGLAVGKYLWSQSITDRDRHSEMLLHWLQHHQDSGGYFKRRNGSDHFILLGRLTWDFRRLTDDDSDWGSKFVMMPLMKNVLRLSVEKSPWDELEVSVPYPTSFHPRTPQDVVEWQNFVRVQKRSSLFSFVGAARTKFKNDFRGLLLNYCRSESSSSRGICRAVDCSVTSCNNGAPEIIEAFLHSDFCLQPRGDGATRRSFFDCMVAGSIPVYFWKESFDGQYQWHVKYSGMTSSVFIDHGDVRNDSSIIRKVLEGMSKEKVRRMRETVIHMIPRLIYYALPASSGQAHHHNDAFDLAIEGVLRKFWRQSISMQHNTR